MSIEIDIEASRSNLLTLTNAHLSAAGHKNLSVDLEWIRLEFARPDRLQITVEIPVSGKVHAPLTTFDDLSSDEQLEEFAQEIAAALPNVVAGRAYLRKYVADIRRAAKDVIAEKNLSGAHLVLKDVGIRPTRAKFLAGGDWQYAVDHLLASVHFRNLDAVLHDRDQYFDVEEAEDVADEIDDCV